LAATLDGLLGERPEVENEDWTFIGSLYFVFTISTTIGYGTFAPVTTGGRVYTMVWAFVGIGTFVNFMQHLSSVWTKYYTRATTHVSTRLTTEALKLDTSEHHRKLITVLLKTGIDLAFSFALLGIFGLVFLGLADIEDDGWGYFESLYYAVITLTTVGLGDYSIRWYGDHAALEIICFLIFTSFAIVIVQEIINSCIHAVQAIRSLQEAKNPVWAEPEPEHESRNDEGSVNLGVFHFTTNKPKPKKVNKLKKSLKNALGLRAASKKSGDSTRDECGASAPGESFTLSAGTTTSFSSVVANCREAHSHQMAHAAWAKATGIEREDGGEGAPQAGPPSCGAAAQIGELALDTRLHSGAPAATSNGAANADLYDSNIPEGSRWF